jgi:hypothetical protein
MLTVCAVQWSSCKRKPQLYIIWEEGNLQPDVTESPCETVKERTFLSVVPHFHQPRSYGL